MKNSNLKKKYKANIKYVIAKKVSSVTDQIIALRDGKAQHVHLGRNH